MTNKQLATQALGRLPDTATWEEIARELELVAAIRQGQADVAAGRVLPHAEVEQAWATEVDRRLERVRQGVAQGKPADEVFRDIRARHQR